MLLLPEREACATPCGPVKGRLAWPHSPALPIPLVPGAGAGQRKGKQVSLGPALHRLSVLPSPPASPLTCPESSATFACRVSVLLLQNGWTIRSRGVRARKGGRWGCRQSCTGEAESGIFLRLLGDAGVDGEDHD